MPATRKMNGRINWPATLRRHFVAERRLRIGVAKVGKFRLSFPYFPAILYFNYACANLYNKSRLDCRWLAAEVFTCCGPVGQHKMLSRNRAAEKSGMPGQARHDERVMAANDQNLTFRAYRLIPDSGHQINDMRLDALRMSPRNCTAARFVFEGD
jgi:hypothetical protein